MKKTLITVVITLIVAALAVFSFNAIWGDGCMLDDDDKECTHAVKKESCDKAEKACCDKKKVTEHHDMMMEKLRPIRAEFNDELDEEEKMMIAGIQEKFEGVDHTKLCPDGQKKFMEEHQADFNALKQIAARHAEYLDGLYSKMHKEMGECCEKNMSSMKDKEADEPAKMAHAGCPEAQKCKDATEKCKGEKEVKAKEECKEKAEKECKEATEKCQQECMNTFKTHFLLLEF
jgi:hypothetical protein